MLSHVPSTTQERIQNLNNNFEELRQHEYYITEKLDGYSVTCYLYNGVFGVCSKDVDLLETQDSVYWNVVKQLDIESKLRKLGDLNIAIQGELIGEGIRKNPYNIKGKTIRFFNIVDIDKFEYLQLGEFINVIHALGLDAVPIIEQSFFLPSSVDSILERSCGKSLLNPAKEREGIVLRSTDMKISFKVISNQFLLKEKD